MERDEPQPIDFDVLSMLRAHQPQDVAREQKDSDEIKAVIDLRSIRDFAAQKIDYIVDQTVAAGTITAFTGESGSGKTTLVTFIVSCIERGVPFCGLDTARRPVLYLDRENGLNVVIERFDRLGINDSPNFKYWGGWNNPEAPSPGGAIVLSWVQSCDPKPVIVLDSAIAFMEGDENSSTDIRKFFHPLRRLADAGATVIVIAHSGKGETSKTFRGSSDIKGAIDIGYLVTNIGDPSRLELVKVSAFKSRFTVMPEMLLRYRDGVFRLDSRPAYETNATKLRALLMGKPGCTVTEFEKVAVDIGISRSRARDWMKIGVESGEIAVVKGDHGSRFHSLAEG